MPFIEGQSNLQLETNAELSTQDSQSATRHSTFAKISTGGDRYTSNECAQVEQSHYCLSPIPNATAT
jgi:hypothetical protein